MRMLAETAARLGARRGARDQTSAVFLAVQGADRAERGPLRSLISARSPGGGVLDVEAGAAFEALRRMQDFLLLRGGDALAILVVHGVVRVRRGGEFYFPIAQSSKITSAQLRAVLRSTEIERQVVVIDCDVVFDRPPAQGEAAGL